MQSPIQQPSLSPLDPPPGSRILDALSRILSLYCFRRANRRKLLGGVCRGMASHLGAPAFLLRIAFIAATVLGAAGIWVYLALWFFIPRERHTAIVTVPVCCTWPIVADPHAPSTSIHAANAREH